MNLEFTYTLYCHHKLPRLTSSTISVCVCVCVCVSACVCVCGDNAQVYLYVSPQTSARHYLNLSTLIHHQTFTVDTCHDNPAELLLVRRFPPRLACSGSLCAGDNQCAPEDGRALPPLCDNGTRDREKELQTLSATCICKLIDKIHRHRARERPHTVHIACKRTKQAPNPAANTNSLRCGVDRMRFRYETF